MKQLNHVDLAVCVGDELSSRSVARQVLSPQQSLTSVFGMGTGGPSALKSLIILDQSKEEKANEFEKKLKLNSLDQTLVAVAR